MEEIGGYGSKVRKIKADLEKKFPGILDISTKATPTITGWLEIEASGKLIHSKKNGDGYVDTQAKYEKIFAGIENALSSR
ncbi:selenoprotein W-like [Saccoglossus kowalevskii]